MNEPRRLLEDDGTPFERSLLSALHEERPSPELAQRMRQGVIVAGVAASANVAVAGWLKVALAGAVAAGLGAGVAVWERRHETPPPVPVAVVTVAPTVAASPVAEAPQVAPERAEPALEPVPPPSASASASASTLPAPPAASSTGDLRDEIRLLDDARAAARTGENRRVLKLLDRYERRFPRGQFRQEVQVLRLEALERSGKKQAARALGKKFLAEHPESPHVERVESVTGSPR